MVSAYWLSPAGDTARGAAMVRVPGAHAERSPRAVCMWWLVGRWPSGAQPAMRSCRRAPGVSEDASGKVWRCGAHRSGGVTVRWLVAAVFGGEL
jgi:hypothetical protein